jgi:hypothetical protein
VLRELIEKVVLVPRAQGKSLDAVLQGDLARILQLCEAAEEKSGSRKRKLPGHGGPGSQVSVVAGPAATISNGGTEPNPGPWGLR